MFTSYESNNCNKMKYKKYHTAGTIPKSNIKIAERGNIDIPNTQIHDRILSSTKRPSSLFNRIQLVLAMIRLKHFSQSLAHSTCNYIGYNI